MAKQWQTSSTIEITGGSDATNPELIAWLGTNAVQQEGPERNYALKPVSHYAKTEVWVDATNLGITDLTGTTWALKNQVKLLWWNKTLHVSSNHLGSNFSTIRFTYKIDFGTGHVFLGLYLGGYTVIAPNDSSPSPNSDTDPIEFTGGSDATNSDLIEWLCENATLKATILKPIRYFIKKTGSGVTDLTGTTWQFNEAASMSLPSNTDITYNINFGSNSLSWTSLQWHKGAKPVLWVGDYIKYDSTYVLINDGMPYWENEAYRTIEIFGGTDATNAALIAWLQENATLVSGGDPVGTYLQPVVLLQKVEEIASTPTLISFTIRVDSSTVYTYQAEEGMTWGEWVNSEYNTRGLISDGMYIRPSFAGPTISYNGGSVGPTDIIITNGSYEYGSHSGGSPN